MGSRGFLKITPDCYRFVFLSWNSTLEREHFHKESLRLTRLANNLFDLDLYLIIYDLKRLLCMGIPSTCHNKILN